MRLARALVGPRIDAATGRPTGSPESPGDVVAVDNAAGTEQRIFLPRQSTDRPDPAHLERRYQEFLRAG